VAHPSRENRDEGGRDAAGNMKSREKFILTINGGSSSIKFCLFEGSGSLRVSQAGQIERIGTPAARLHVDAGVQGDGRALSPGHAISGGDHAAAVAALVEWIAGHGAAASLIAIGHRIVHGGPDLHRPQRVTPGLLRELRRITALDPEHLPGEIALAEAFGRRFPQLPQIACFDTAFHHALPPVARLLPIPRRYEEQGVRRYGFHGLSFEFLMGELIRMQGETTGRGRIILAHLGNGASLAAVRDGKPMDTSMGLTPSAGVPMGTRSGDLDPGLAWYLARTEGLDAKQFNHMVNFESGLLGVSETSADMRDLLRDEAADPRAAEAVALFCYQVKRWIGSFAAVLGGLDTLVFSGGIGENAALVRARICAGLGFLGIEINDVRNARNAGLISNDSAGVAVRVMQTNEALVIARAVQRCLGPDPGASLGHP
jgi:acetate kinase